MLKDFGYIRTFPHNLAQINIKSKPCHPVQIYQTRTVVFFVFFQEKGLDKKSSKKVDTTGPEHSCRKRKQ